jgi:cell division transport system permease protein
MALKVDYVVKETGRNLVRNPLLSLATVVVVVVAVALVGGSLLLRQGVANATSRWRGDIEFIVFMNPDASPEQIEGVQGALEESPQVDSFIFFDKEDALREYQELFAEDQPEFVDLVTPDALPTSFRVKPVTPDSTVVDALVQQFGQEPGVFKVVAATDVIRKIQRISNLMSVGIALVAVVLTAAAMLFIGFTIQTAVFSRRREIEVMKLVGATNWFIRVPFMLEGVVQGIFGAMLGILAVFGLDRFLDTVVAGDDGLGILTNFSVASGDVLATAIALFLGAVIITAIASMVAVSFYVNV